MNDLRVKHILAPVDLGHSSEAALRCARTLVRALDAKLTLMYINDALTLQSYDQIYTGNRDIPGEQRRRMEDVVRGWAAPIMGADPYGVIVMADDPVRGIVAAAAQHDVDLIVTGTHGRRGWERLMGGSVAEDLLHRTDRPVITVPHSADIRLSDLVCPINFTDVAHRAARAACCMSKAMNARLHMLHVADHSIADLAGRVKDWLGDGFAKDCNVHEIIARRGAVAEQVVDYASDVGAGVIVVGAHQRTPRGHRAAIGTTTEQIMRISPMAVLSVVRPMTVVDRVISAA